MHYPEISVMSHKVVLILAILNAVQGQDDPSTTVLPTPTEKGLSPEMLDKIYSFTKNTKFFRNHTREKTAFYFNELNDWEVPEVDASFPYYLAGYDYENRPVWVYEVGKYDLRGFLGRSEENKIIFERYMMKSFIYIMQSLLDADRPGDEARKANFLYDMENFEMRQVAHLPTMGEVLRIGLKYQDLYMQYTDGMLILNSNYPTKMALDIVRPMLGNMMEKLEVLGSGKSQWLPRLLHRFPPDILPPWYGGSPNFKPLMVKG